MTVQFDPAMLDYKDQILDIFEAGRVHISSIKPSDWTEQNVIMKEPFPGPFRYDRTPYTREIIDCLAPDHPARIIAVKKGAQIGFSSGVIYPGIGWIMKNQPGNTLLMVGSPDLIEKSMEKIDLMIDGAGLRSLIKPSVQRKKAGKTGDTNLKKEFPNGYVSLGSASNHKAIRQVDLKYIFMDDFESVKSASKESGDTRKLVEQRAAAYANKSKIFYISTPELKQGSNIEPAYLLGDQRKFMIPCPCCGEFIDFHWSIPVEHSDDMGGITWKTDSRRRVISESVGYICQKCGGFFNDRNKYALLQSGFWKATAEPSKLGYYSYSISSLYAPPGMFDWEHYVNNWLECHPEGQPRKEAEYKSFVNLCLGECYEELGEAPKANELQKNCRNYEIGIIPEKMSIADGNGRIVLLTCASDLNGVEEDARLDYEVVAWSESGASYSVQHGSIGTFVYREGENKSDRKKWTYEHYRSNSVWPDFKQVLEKKFSTDTGRSLPIVITAVDTGHYTKYAYSFIDNCKKLTILAFKGDKENKYRQFGTNLPSFKLGRERNDLFLIDVNKVKDDLADYMKLRWEEKMGEKQPDWFMNYPIPSGGLYQFNNFFSHYESEHRVIENKDGQGIGARWVKKTSTSQNHFWDCRVYNLALKDVYLYLVAKEYKLPALIWSDYAALIRKGIK